MTGNVLFQRFQKMREDPLFGRVMMAAFIIVLIALAYSSFIRGGVDFRGYYAAAVLVLRGGNPYDYHQLAPVLQEFTGEMGNNPYYYPPWFCLFFIPLALLPFQVARIVWLGINAVLFVLSLDLVYKVIQWPHEKWKRWGVNILGTILFAVSCFRSEQAGVLLFLGASLALFGIQEKRSFLTALGLVLMMTKPQATGFAVLFLGIWLIYRQRKSLYWAIAITVMLLAVSSLLIPHWWSFSYQGFGRGLFLSLDGPDKADGIRVTATLYDFLRFQLGITPTAWLIFPLLVIFTCAIIWFLKLHGWNDPLFLMSMGILYTLLITPYAVTYDYVPLITLFLLILRETEICFEKEKKLVYAGIEIMLLSLPFQEYAYTAYIMMLILFLQTMLMYIKKPISQVAV